MSLKQQIACILQSKDQHILKMPRHEQQSHTYAYWYCQHRSSKPTQCQRNSLCTRQVASKRTPVICLTFTDCL